VKLRRRTKEEQVAVCRGCHPAAIAEPELKGAPSQKKLQAQRIATHASASSSFQLK
jgi:hypothetical protein